MTQPMDAIDHLVNGENNEFRGAIEDMLMARVRDRIDNERIAVGQTMFANEEESDFDYDEEEYSDEEV